MRNLRNRHNKRRAIQLLNINFQLYVVVITFLMLLYNAPVYIAGYRPLYFVAAWGGLLLLQLLALAVVKYRKHS
jgi:hypothetical protein